MAKIVIAFFAFVFSITVMMTYLSRINHVNPASLTLPQSECARSGAGACLIMRNSLDSKPEKFSCVRQSVLVSRDLKDSDKILVIRCN